jgi:predicted AAA+ superfamily ATPase
MIVRTSHVLTVERLLRQFPVVAIAGPRQVGKTTLARQILEGRSGPKTFLDLEDPRDAARLGEPMLALGKLKGLVVIDEVQRRPDLFPVLRVLADRPRPAARFLLAGSASPELVRNSSESLAGRVAVHRMDGFSLQEVGSRHVERLWLRGGFPLSYLAGSEAKSALWRREFVGSLLERDLRDIGVNVSPTTLRRFWSMLAHYHGHILNSSELARAFGISDNAVRRYLDLLVGTFLVRQLAPWHENLSKRQVKSPKVYVRDSGMLHALLGIESLDALEGHPQVGASFEGFAMDAVISRLGLRADECFFWATHSGAELDLLVIRDGRRLGFEFKRTDSPQLTRSMHTALEDLRLERLDVVHLGSQEYPLEDRVRALPVSRVPNLKPLP